MINFAIQRDIKLTVEDLQAFEDEVARIYDTAAIHAPVHLSWGNEKELIEIFRFIHPNDWVLSNWRNHYHALLHGVPKDELMKEILIGHSCSFQSPKHKFFTSAIVGGIVPIAIGTALGEKWNNTYRKTWCFVGDMTSENGQFYEAVKFAARNNLPVHFIIEDNGLSTNTPTQTSWGLDEVTIPIEELFPEYVTRYKYIRSKYPHVCTRTWVQF